MIFVFENYNKNFISCEDINHSGIQRCTPSPMIETILRYKDTNKTFSNINFDNVRRGTIADVANSIYIIPSGVAHDPTGWCGGDVNSPERKNLFEYLNERYLEDLRSAKAFLLLDQSHEGYHVDWLFEWFHMSCERFGINPRQIIYVTGDMDVESKYNEWASQHLVVNKMLVLSYPIFENAVYRESINLTRIKKLPPLITVNENIEFKVKNLEDIKLYNCLQKRPRAHRIWLFNKLYFNNLLKDGINSMNHIIHQHTYYVGKIMAKHEYEQIEKLLPMLPPSDEEYTTELKDFEDIDSGKYQMRFNDDLMMKTWLSVISEASFAENTCFLSEKVFKPLAAGHPFIVYGNKHSLHYLRELGYKTFSPFIDETYDTLDTWDRLDAIINSLNKLKQMNQTEKLHWYVGMKDILLHNQEVIKKNSVNNAPAAFIKLFNYLGV
jgi:hypothetical protein